MPFQLSERDKARLENVHPDLVAVVHRAAAISSQRFIVTCGVRTIAEQRRLVAEGKSKTMNSRHIPTKTGLGHAVDLAPINGAGKVDWGNPHPFVALGATMKRAASDLGISLEWGGDWPGAWDKPHYQLPWKEYPGATIASLGASRTVHGLTAAATGQGIQQGAQPISESLDTVVATLSPVADASQTIAVIVAWVKLAGVALTLAGLVYAAYARWDDAGRPLPRFLERFRTRGAVGAGGE